MELTTHDVWKNCAESPKRYQKAAGCSDQQETGQNIRSLKQLGPKTAYQSAATNHDVPG